MEGTNSNSLNKKNIDNNTLIKNVDKSLKLIKAIQDNNITDFENQFFQDLGNSEFLDILKDNQLIEKSYITNLEKSIEEKNIIKTYFILIEIMEFYIEISNEQILIIREKAQEIKPIYIISNRLKTKIEILLEKVFINEGKNILNIADKLNIGKEIIKNLLNTYTLKYLMFAFGDKIQITDSIFKSISHPKEISYLHDLVINLEYSLSDYKGKDGDLKIILHKLFFDLSKILEISKKLIPSINGYTLLESNTTKF